MKPLNEKIEKTLDSLDGLTRAQPSPDFKSKVMARWTETPQRDQWLPYLKYGIAAMIFMALANILTLFTWETVAETDEFTTEVIEQYLDASDIYEDSYE